MSEIVYAVHTRACTYLLDEEGICKWVLSRSGQRSDDRCVGAQFVAALDLGSRGGLIGELRIGSSALFIRSEGGRFVLIRTKPIEHVEIRGAQAEPPPEEDLPPEVPAHYGYAYPQEPEPEPVVLPSHLAVAGVFEAPAPAPEPSPPSEQRVIVQGWADPYSAPPADPYSTPPADPYSAPPPVPLPAPPPRTRAEPSRRAASSHRSHAASEPPASPAYAPEPAPAPSRRGFPAPPPRPAVPIARASRNDVQETQPLPPLAPSPPAGPVPAWPPMLAPPPPPAEMLPLGPARPDLPSSEELDVDDLEEVGEDEQVYSMEVTLSLPLFRQDPHAGQAWRR